MQHVGHSLSAPTAAAGTWAVRAGDSGRCPPVWQRDQCSSSQRWAAHSVACPASQASCYRERRERAGGQPHRNTIRLDPAATGRLQDKRLRWCSIGVPLQAGERDSQWSEKRVTKLLLNWAKARAERTPRCACVEPVALVPARWHKRAAASPLSPSVASAGAIGGPIAGIDSWPKGCCHGRRLVLQGKSEYRWDTL